MQTTSFSLPLPVQKQLPAWTFRWSFALLLMLILWVNFSGVTLKRPILASEINKEQGNCYTVGLGALKKWRYFLAESDGSGSLKSSAILFEDGRPLASAHSQHDMIRNAGAGKYSHWNTDLYFSTSDNSDPRINGRRYLLEASAHLPILHVAILFVALLLLLRRELKYILALAWRYA